MNIALRLSVFTVAVALCSAARAQVAPEGADGQSTAARSGTGDGSTSGNSEIIVTAQRRSENVQNVPISISVVTGETMARQNINNLDTIALQTPGLTTARLANSSTVFIRGVGSQQAGIDPSVAVYVDDVYQAAASSNLLDFNNVARVEVLRGPQGTLFGRNAAGGVVHIITRDPEYKPELRLEAGYGNFDTLSGNLYATTGLGDTLAVNLALHGEKRNDGWGRNLTTGNDAYRQRNWAARGKILWEPNQATRVVLGAFYNYYDGDEGLSRTSIPGTLSAGGVGNAGFYNNVNTTDTVNRIKQSGVNLHVSQTLGSMNITSITAYNYKDQFFDYDADAAPALAVEPRIQYYDRSFSQELRLSSDSNGPLRWIIGGYYYWNRFDVEPNLIVGPNTTTFARQTTNSFAGFGQLTYQLTSQFALTAGLRYTHETHEISGRRLNAAGVVTAQVDDAQVTHNRLTWRLSAEFRANEELLLYASYNRGFKAGLFDMASFTNPPVEPEILDAYEIGLKTDLLDRRLRFNLGTFLYQYKNIQLTQINVGVSQLLNAAKAKIYGLEAELTFRPIPELTLTANTSLLHGRYTSFPDGPHYVPRGAAVTCANVPFPAGSAGGQVLTTCNLTGRNTINSPPFTATLGATYRVPASFGDFDLGANYSYNDGYYFEPDNSVRQNAYSLVNAYAQFSAPDDRWYAKVWGRNLNNARYFSAANSSAQGKHYSAAAPRTFGVTIGVNFH